MHGAIAVPRKYKHPNPESGWLSRQQAAELFGLSVSYLAHLPPDKLRQRKLGRKIFILRVDVEALIVGEQTPPSSPRSEQ
jgi:hypothetical protein